MYSRVYYDHQLYTHPYMTRQQETFMEYIPVQKNYVDYETQNRTIQVPMQYYISEYNNNQYQYIPNQSQYVQGCNNQINLQSQQQVQLTQSRIYYTQDPYRPQISLDDLKYITKNKNNYSQLKKKRSRIFS